jgi:CPA1 family monovalent cation:H+ antiporter
VSRDLIVTAGGGMLVGLACAAGALVLAGRITDHLIETVLTAATAYGAFLAAEYLDVSGVLATLTAGVVMGRPALLGRYGARIVSSAIVSSDGREFLKSFWEFAACRSPCRSSLC